MDEIGMVTFPPMLAHSYNKYGSRAPFPVLVQPKLDGQRCISVESGLWSRTGKSIASVPLLEQEIIRDFPDIPLDGELYAHDEDFESIMSTTRRTVNIAESNDIEYWVYDTYHPTLGFGARYEKLKQYFARRHALSPVRVRLVPTYLCNNIEEVMRWLSTFLEAGFEGLMVRQPLMPYEVDKRSRSLLKLKTESDMEVTIVDFVEGAGRNYGRLGSLLCQLDSGAFVKVGIGISDDERETIWNNQSKYEGRVLTIKYQNLTRLGIPRFPKVFRWREEE